MTEKNTNSLVAKYEHHTEESAGNSIGLIVSNNQLNEKINPRVHVHLHIGGHLEIQDGRHPKKNRFSI